MKCAQMNKNVHTIIAQVSSAYCLSVFGESADGYSVLRSVSLTIGNQIVGSHADLSIPSHLHYTLTLYESWQALKR